jgi:hypothetical protein
MNTDLLIDLLFDPCGTLAIGLVMYVAGDLASAGDPAARRAGAGVAGLTLIAVMAFGILSGMNLFALALGATGVGLLTLGTAWIVLSIAFAMFKALVSAMTPRFPEVMPEPAPPILLPTFEPEPLLLPPPPTREERMASAKERFENALHMLSESGLDETELKAAQEKAKQQYLRDVDGII